MCTFQTIFTATKLVGLVRRSRLSFCYSAFITITTRTLAINESKDHSMINISVGHIIGIINMYIQNMSQTIPKFIFKSNKNTIKRTRRNSRRRLKTFWIPASCHKAISDGTYCRNTGSSSRMFVSNRRMKPALSALPLSANGTPSLWCASINVIIPFIMFS